MSDTRKQKIEENIALIETEMAQADFWTDKHKAQATIAEYQKLKDALSGVGKYDAGDAVMTIFSGAGGDDAEDFSAMLFDMYRKFAERKNFQVFLIHENKNDHNGFRNVTFEIKGKTAYGILKNESGVHRLVRISPFNSKKLRHTSFSLVEVIPKFDKSDLEISIPDSELSIEFAKSSGPGGQNVNKRETAVRIVHVPTGLAVHADGERSQEANRDRAMSLLKGKIYRLREEEQKAEKERMYISKSTDIEWGNQIRSYVLHPYKMV
ncbi:MAG: PCRF domain-containing protein, partial [Candidatus Pacebacteria bacterium]|nr:PCRF domain-containing protein [Candidatus Paceibacterota bacterium]MBP9852114.1 PCRF domain-containing protein [Candidatus Paceibacterota bacterium]